MSTFIMSTLLLRNLIWPLICHYDRYNFIKINTPKNECLLIFFFFLTKI